MDHIEFRLRRSDDELEPYYVRIAEAGDGAPLAFTENDATEEAGAAVIAALGAGGIDFDTLYDGANDVWFYRLKSSDGEVLFRSMPCATEEAMQETIDRIITQAADAPVIDDRAARS